jgi:hypothetical protein
MRSALLPVFLITMLLCSCKAPENLITSRGIPFYNLGEPFSGAGVILSAYGEVRDTVFQEGDYTWNAVIVPQEQGRIIIEDDFESSGTVNRIRVETPDLQLRRGIRVGDPITKLQRISGKWFVNYYPEIRTYSLYNRKFPNTHFLVGDPVFKPGSMPMDHIANISLSARIRAIVIM